jgi:intracellular septation protein
MAALLEFSPLLAFLVAYWRGGIYVATGTLMVAMGVLLLVDLLLSRRLPRMHLLSALLVWLLGTATLLLHDVRFIQWKPTIFMWALALAFLGSVFIGEQPLAQRLLQQAVGDQAVPRRTWLRLNTAWILFYVLAGGANLLVAWNLSEALWVKFKVIGLTLATLAFALAQAFWLGNRTKSE